jgi:hypothetical protein
MILWRVISARYISPPAEVGGRMEYLLYTLDRTVEEGESGGYCADWHAEQSRKNVGDLISD